MGDTKELLDFEIYPNLDRAETVRDLEPQDRGDYYKLTCPECGKREAYLYKHGLYINCSRKNKCSHSQSLWSYIQNKGDLSNQETLQELARLANYTLPELTGYSKERAEKARQRADILEAALNFCKTQWEDDVAHEAQEYLASRGYTETEITNMELGFYPSQEELTKHLTNKGYTRDMINNVGLQTTGFGDTHKIVIPYRDVAGRLKGFIVRAIDSTEPKYRFSRGVEKDSLFNLHRARGTKDLVVTEGYLDALIAVERGIKGTVGLGSSSLANAQLDTAIKYGARNIILALDNDAAGQDGIERALRLINKNHLKAFVAELPDEYKDPDEFIKAKGIESFREAIRTAQSGARWMAQRILSKQDLKTDRGQEAALTETLMYEEMIADPIETKYFRETIREELDIPGGVLNELTMDYREKKSKERLRDGYRDLFRKGLELLEKGTLEDIDKHLVENLSTLKAQTAPQSIELYDLETLEQDISQSPEGLLTGYPSLNNIIRIPQEAITIIGGRPSHGKTTFLLNLCLNMIADYPDQAFLFFSYEESKRQVGLKVIDILSGDMINETQNLRQLENYLRGRSTERHLVEEGKEEFKKITESKRLWLIDEPYSVDDLANTLAYMKEQHPIGAVFIDYIQKVKINGRYPTRQVELQKVSERVLEAAKSLSLPIILGAQFGRDKEHRDKVRLDNLRESGDIEQDANLVIGLYNEAMKKAQEQDDWPKDRVVDLELTILKNRNGPVQDCVTLSFDRPILTIKEKLGE